MPSSNSDAAAFIGPRAAIVGATLALKMAFPVILDEAVPNRLGRAVAALFEAEAILALQCLPEAA